MMAINNITCMEATTCNTTRKEEVEEEEVEDEVGGCVEAEEELAI